MQRKIGFTVFTGPPFSNTKDTKVTKEKLLESRFFPIFVYLVLFVFSFSRQKREIQKRKGVFYGTTASPH
jgi:hypothetical protein